MTSLDGGAQPVEPSISADGPVAPAGASTTGFYWQAARDSLLTKVAIQLFQIAAGHDGEDFDTATDLIDAEYAILRGQPSERHGGKFQTAVQVYQEAGWISLAGGRLTITDAGRQALALMGQAPDFLKAVPYFVVALLARYQIKNPARPPVRNDEIAELRKTSDLFPYWTIWKVMRECGNQITIEELQRFLFRLHRAQDVESTIKTIQRFRADKATLSEVEIDAKYPTRLQGANSEPKYWMGRAGAQIGKYPPMIEKSTPSTYVLNKNYLPLVDSVLANEPLFRDYLNEDTWFADYGRSVQLGDIAVGEDSVSGVEIQDLIAADDPLAREVELLLNEGSRSFLLTGPPGTSKSWYARQLGSRIVDHDTSRIRLVQFHPSYGYEDFIEGFVPKVVEEGGLPTFVREWKVFAEVCDLARDGSYAVLIIDEFSRGDAGRIFGEALTYIEEEYRESNFKLASGRYFSIPTNLVIIATMNPFDRSVSAVDVAMQRRFEILQLLPDETILNGILTDNGMTSELITRVTEFFRTCQEVMPHGGLGHTYFLKGVDIPSLVRIWKFKLAPLIEQELRFDPSGQTRIEDAYRIMVAE